MKHLWLAALLLSGCAAANDLDVRAETPASVTVWGRSTYCVTCRQSDAVTDQQMTDAATAHCSQYGKTARRAYERHDTRGRAITFDCVAE